MKHIRYLFRNGVVAGLVVVLAGVAPVSAMAQDVAQDITQAPIASANQTESEGPAGADDGAHLQKQQLVAVPPTDAETQVNPSGPASPEEAYAEPQNEKSMAPHDNMNKLPTGPITDNKEHVDDIEHAGGNYKEDNQTKDTQTLDSVTSTTIDNTIESSAHSGDATAEANTTAGNVASGDSTAMANVVNLLHSQTDLIASDLQTFTANIQGNNQGDFLIDPALLAQPAGAPVKDLTNLTVNTATDATIDNTINLTAQSGNAEATRNTTVGNVSSGDAHAVANDINMIDSVVAANQSFVGVVNIHGDYTGNILMPADSLQALLGSTAIAGTIAREIDVDTDSSQKIQNNIDLSANSGAVSATQNTTAGSAASGNGLNNLTMLNLTNRHVVAENSLLVFVNVLGNWVGLIMDAPAGTTTAALGGTIARNEMNNPAVSAVRADINSKEDMGIKNTIKADARSGTAMVTQNTSVGEVQSGNATASANIGNVIGSQFDLANWFGVLFINVFGTWRGDFGVAKQATITPITSGLSGPVSGAASVMEDAAVFTFRPEANAATTQGPTVAAGNDTHGNGTGRQSFVTVPEMGAGGTLVSHNRAAPVSRVLPAGVAKSVGQPAMTAPATHPVAGLDWSPMAVALGLAGFGLVGADRFRTNLRNRRVGTHR